MKLSIVTVCFNAAATIADTLQSVAGQTYSDLEHIVVDGGSTDGTQDIVRLLGMPGIILVSEPDEGIYDAMNKGLRLARGDWVGFLNADDVFATPDVVADLVATIERTSADVVYGDLEFVNRIESKRVVRRWQSGPFVPARMRWGWMPPHPTFYAKRVHVQRLGGFDTRFRVAADYDFMLRYLSATGMTVTYLPRVMVRMKTGGVSGERSAQAVLRRNVESYRVLRKNRLGGVAALFWKSFRKIPQLF